MVKPKQWTKESWEKAHAPKPVSIPPLEIEVDPTPKKSASEKTAACPELHGQKEKPAIVVGYNFKAAAECPVCAERNRKNAERVRRYRKRKKEEE